MSLYNFEVYKCFYGDDLVYIGQGRLGRHNHCLSGNSHCRELNAIVKSGEKHLLRIEIVREFKHRDNAVAHEDTLIHKHKPKFNKVYRRDLLDNKKLRFKLEDIYMIKYFAHRGVSLKDLQKMFYEYDSPSVSDIFGDELYIKFPLPFLKYEKSIRKIDKFELDCFESRYEKNILFYCLRLGRDKVKKLDDLCPTVNIKEFFPISQSTYNKSIMCPSSLTLEQLEFEIFDCQ